MPNNERPAQKPSTRGTVRKSGARPLSMNTTQEQSVRDTQYPEGDFVQGEDDPYASNPPRPPSSAIRLNPPATRRSSSRDISTETRRSPAFPNPNVPPRRTQRQDFIPAPGTAVARPVRNITTAYDRPPVKPARRRNIHWLLYVGLGMVAAIGLAILSMNVLNWGTNVYNNIIYGYPRTFQTNAIVGHNDGAADPSHFIAVNLHGQIIIFELPGGDPSKSIDYIGPDLVGASEDLLPVTLTFQDINHDGAVDMLVHVADKDFPFCNNTKAKKFQACPASVVP